MRQQKYRYFLNHRILRRIIGYSGKTLTSVIMSDKLLKSEGFRGMKHGQDAGEGAGQG
jgi:hypothetical protein